MKPLFIYYNNANQVTLTGEADTVIQGCRYAPGTGKVSLAAQGEVIEETIDLILEGPAEDIDAKVYLVEKFLEMANQESIKRDWIYLRFYDGETYDWRSRIVGGRIEFLNHGLVDRDNESQWAKLLIRRLNFWAGSRRSCPCFTSAQADPATGTYIAELFGHSDAAHKNYFGIDGHASENDLPTPLELDFMNPYTADQFYNITISERILRGTSRTDAGYVEGEALAQGSGAVRSVVADAGCSAGSYGSFAWNSAAEVQLSTWAVTSADLAILRGQVQRGLVRLQAAMAYTDLWLCLKILNPSGVLMSESLWMLAPAGTLYLELPPIAIPPGLSGYDLYQPVTVAIYARKTGGGAAAVPIDFIQFVPAETIRRLTYTNNAMTMGLNNALVDSGTEEETYYKNADGTKAISHIGTGNFPLVYPGYDSIIHVNHRAGGDGTYTIDGRYSVLPFYEPRRRNL